MNHLVRIGLASVAISLTACSVLEGDKLNYRSATVAPTLEVPPDLAQLSRDSRYAIPGNAVTASNFQTKPTAPSAIAARSTGDAHIESAGSQQWLVVNRPPEKLWDEVKDFWQQSGFNVIIDQAPLGIMETDWAENRAKIPQDIIRRTIGKVFDALYSSGEQDKFRTRLERNADGGTDIFISHRGMVEVYTTNTKDTTKWQPRPADPGLEAEFVKRLMLKLGGQAEAAQASAAATPVKLPSKARVVMVGAQSVVQLDEGFDRAWRRVGLSLDRTGFTVEDRDRAKGTYFVRYVEPSAKQAEPGFIAKFFAGGTPPVAPVKLRVVLNSVEASTQISVQNAEGATETSAIAQRIVNVIADDLK